jgi:hypothetical protein
VVVCSPAQSRKVFHFPDVDRRRRAGHGCSHHDPGDDLPLLQLVTALTGLRLDASTLDHIATAPLNIATALHAEATSALSVRSSRGWIYFPMAFS